MAGLSSKVTPTPPQSIWARKKDAFYVVFLSLVVFLAATLDFVPFYPVEPHSWPTKFYDYYYTTYNDPLYVKDPAFFKFFVVVEAFYTVPTALWSIRGLIKDDKVVPVYLLVLATFLVTSTMVCLVEVLATKDWPKEDIDKNVPGYVGFLAIAAGLWLDMFFRVKAGLTGKTKLN